MSTTNDKSKVVVGIDVGGSTTKIVGFRRDGQNETLIAPLFVQATDPITSIYGAFGRFTMENGLSLDDIDKVMMTGGGSSFRSQPIYSLPCNNVSEFECIGLGGLYLSGLDEAIVVSMGTGTALIHSKKVGGATEIKYLGGTGVGGGTLLGLTQKLTGVGTVEHIEALCAEGNISKIDLRISDISKNRTYENMKDNLTVSNFGKVSDIATPEDLALGVANMVAETIAMVAVFAARGCGVKDVVLTGNLSTIAPIRQTFEGLDQFGVNFIIPENAQFGTVIGAALHDSHKCI
ncbi:MAG: pantothenate kinase [Ruminococcaceae bacterium]|nr:pantothenate kinase [Oscillospiraceae bacterium]